jgi:hypothetical protein
MFFLKLTQKRAISKKNIFFVCKKQYWEKAREPWVVAQKRFFARQFTLSHNHGSRSGV